MVIITKVEIAASPEVVRRVLLDFSKIPEWHTGLVKTITPLDNDDPVSVGKKLHCTNTPTKFAWQGPPVMSVSGLHSFLFEPSTVTPGNTTFTQMEEYSGPISFLMQPWLMGRTIKGQFEKFNADLKARCEGL
ncbi:Polyketide cyclase dehydrase protein [Rutstroemia sp. NJR-2017a WRK4]|nr:Polyketide cyclase dehydrase protein [Rutstroemia sp. NJR-2017a WRK4]